MPIPGHTDDFGIFLYGNMGGVACSCCAPIGAPHDEITSFATEHYPPKYGSWKIVDVATVRQGPPSPTPCNQSTKREHWFLVSQ